MATTVLRDGRIKKKTLLWAPIIIAKFIIFNNHIVNIDKYQTYYITETLNKLNFQPLNFIIISLMKNNIMCFST